MAYPAGALTVLNPYTNVGGYYPSTTGTYPYGHGAMYAGMHPMGASYYPMHAGYGFDPDYAYGRYGRRYRRRGPYGYRRRTLCDWLFDDDYDYY
jgi:hypothetical protein